MKNIIPLSSLLVAAFTALAFFSGCNKTNFSVVEQSVSNKSDIPVDGVDPVPLPVDPSFAFKLSNGECKSDSSTQLLSCLKCNVPQVVAKPQLSAKAQALLDIMFLSCNIKNKSDPTDVRPTQAMILNKLNQATEKNYPETKRNADTSLLIQALSNPNDDSLRQKMFSKFYYTPPYSDTFELYFGLTIGEAKSTFCWYGDKMNGEVTNKTGVYSIEWLNCQYDGPVPCEEKPIWLLAQKYRKQLDTALKLGVTNPYTAPTPDLQKKCKWLKFEGDDVAAAKVQLKKWRAEGRVVSVNIKNNGIGQCSSDQDADLPVGSTVEMATYKCE